MTQEAADSGRGGARTIARRLSVAHEPSEHATRETAGDGGARLPSSGRRLRRPTAGARIARNTAIFSIPTGLSRIAGLAREIVAASYFGTTGPVLGVHDRLPGPEPGPRALRRRGAERRVRPRLHRAAGEASKREAFRLAAALFGLILVVLGALTALFIAARAAWSCRCSPATSSRRSSTT